MSEVIRGDYFMCYNYNPSIIHAQWNAILLLTEGGDSKEMIIFWFGSSFP